MKRPTSLHAFPSGGPVGTVGMTYREWLTGQIVAAPWLIKAIEAGTPNQRTSQDVATLIVGAADAIIAKLEER